jgi:uncharacterized membrane protein
MSCCLFLVFLAASVVVVIGFVTVGDSMVVSSPVTGGARAAPVTFPTSYTKAEVDNDLALKADQVKPTLG